MAISRPMGRERQLSRRLQHLETRSPRHFAPIGRYGPRDDKSGSASRNPRITAILREYEEKRRFSLTPEPLPLVGEERGPLIFVVQRHASRRLHFDFRLEVDGVLKSWAVPHGPSLEPGTKRLAVMVEDHPLSYAAFEGTIPEGEYGAGQVAIWDTGAYSPEVDGRVFFGDRAGAQQAAQEGLARGKLKVLLQGRKLKGVWTLVKMARGEKDWLFIRHQQESGRDIPVDDAPVVPQSSIGDTTMSGGKSGHETGKIEIREFLEAREAPFTGPVEPMLATPASAPFFDPDWLFEPKLDGYRIIAIVKNGVVRLQSRRKRDVTAEYPHLAADLAQQPVSEVVLDGEIVAFDEAGRPCFQCLQARLQPREEVVLPPLIYYIFDILYLNGYDLSGVALHRRKEILKRLLTATEHVQLVEAFDTDGIAVYKAAISHGLEGVVAKKKESVYQSGRRSRDWLKIRAMLSDDFVIGGYTIGSGARHGSLGALLLGYYDTAEELTYAGHVGTGFDEAMLEKLRSRLEAIKTDRCPFTTAPPLNAPTTWVRPEMVAEVKFSEWTRDGLLRTPVFLRLREDKSPWEVRRVDIVSIQANQIPIAAPNESTTEKVRRQLENPAESFILYVEGHRFLVNNLNKELWPRHGELGAVTKRDLLKYYNEVSPYLLPHLRDRPLSLNRYPDGIYGEHFYQKHWTSPMPEAVTRVKLLSEHEGRQEYLICDNLATLLWLGQLADLELHTWFSRVSLEPDHEYLMEDTGGKAMTPDFLVEYPDFIIFDLDPYIYSGNEARGAEPELNRAAFSRCCEAAVRLKEALDSLPLESFVKTSGKTGLHIYVPLVRRFGYDMVRSTAYAICRFVQGHHPDLLTLEWAVDRRSGKVFLDYNQNVSGKTLASVYSPRPTPEATISMPVGWENIRRVYPTSFTVRTALTYLKTTGDLWANISKAKRDLNKVVESGMVSE